MPLYEYKCHGCGKTFEVIQKFSDEPLKTHPECGGETERLLSPPALQFKGSGWYVTDYARANGGSKSEGGKSENSGSEKKTESGDKKSGSESSGGDAKSAASSESKTSQKPSSSDSK